MHNNHNFNSLARKVNPYSSLFSSASNRARWPDDSRARHSGPSPRNPQTRTESQNGLSGVPRSREPVPASATAKDRSRDSMSSDTLNLTPENSVFVLESLIKMAGSSGGSKGCSSNWSSSFFSDQLLRKIDCF